MCYIYECATLESIKTSRNVSVSIYLFQGLEVVHGQKLSSYDRRLIKRLCTGIDIVMRPDKLLFICTFCHQRFSQLIFRHFQNCFQAFGLGPGEFRGGFPVGDDTFEAALQERPVLFGLHDDLQEDHIPPSPPYLHFSLFNSVTSACFGLELFLFTLVPKFTEKLHGNIRKSSKVSQSRYLKHQTK